MKILSTDLVLFVAMLHFGFLVLEMFYWDHEIGRRIFSMTPEQSSTSALLAMNQGLYNGFLAVGLVWGVLKHKLDVILFFLLCVVVAGVFAAITVKISIFFTQALPALVALIIVFVHQRKAD